MVVGLKTKLYSDDDNKKKRNFRDYKMTFK